MTSLLGTMGADWLLKRAFKFLLKKNLGSILQNEVSMVSHWPAAAFICRNAWKLLRPTAAICPSSALVLLFTLRRSVPS